ncbi:GntR family transcriptional regulator [Bradyrhizobium sp. CCBAU 53421]|uniref:GntR family transcriptional regulator n=1 Tax=Bradyrhizobium sp. CCBAU 53421 TaxID=1325120 RepID=UPI00188A70AA|nr:GntR family transcriptional regulator [Bradyrhizobium sp. CCBAU 53421]QOZ36474.1 GntR family transcriptional regulator [Bradyrhizobium sp. CCBAU 53421]
MSQKEHLRLVWQTSGSPLMQKTVAGSLHETVRQELVRRVMKGEYKAEAPLPSVATLAEEFGVSAITIKRALRDLQSTGILRTVPGLGTFIRERHRFIRDVNFGFVSSKDGQRSEREPRIQLASVSREAIRHPSFSEFDAPTGTMLCLRKIISADGIPLIFDTSYFPLSFDSVFDEYGDELACEALHNCGANQEKISLLIDAAPASEEAQQAFGIPNGYPTLRRLYELTTLEPAFTVFGISESPFDRLACSVHLNRTDTIRSPMQTS